MPDIRQHFENLCTTAGRILLGIYFIVPGINKITNFEGNSQYMAEHGMVLIPFFLVLTIILQVGGGVAANSRLRAMAQQRCDDAGIQLRVPRPGLCTDNGAMVASLGAQMMMKGRPASDLSLPADSSLPVTDVRTGLPVHVDHDHAH